MQSQKIKRYICSIFAQMFKLLLCTFFAFSINSQMAKKSYASSKLKTSTFLGHFMYQLLYISTSRVCRPNFCKKTGLDLNRWLNSVFSVNLVCKKKLNLMLKVSETSSQGAVGLELGGTDYQDFMTCTINNKKFIDRYEFFF